MTGEASDGMARGSDRNPDVEPAGDPSPEPRGPGLGASRAIPLTVGACFFIEGLDATILATSLPQIAEAMDVTPHETGIALTAYLISVSVWMAASGWLADRFEMRRIFMSAIAIFILGSLVCGVSQNLMQLVAGRFLQGMGGALMVPVGRLILARSFPRDQLVRAMSYMIIPGLLGPMLGPVLGGMITTYLEWRWIFFINLPLGAIALLLAMRYLTPFPAGGAARFDTGGFLLVAIALVAFQMSLESAAAESRFGTLSLAGLGAGLAASLVYGWHARRGHPILDLRLFRYRVFAVAVIGGSVSRIGLGATLFLFPLYFQLGLGASAVEAGYLMGVLAVGQIALRLGIDPLLRLLGIKALLVGNSVATSLLLAGLLAFGPGDSLWILGGFLFLFGMLQAIHLSTLAGLNFSGLPADVLGRATSIAAVVQRLAMALGISFAALVLGLASDDAETARASFVMPTLAVAAILLLSGAGFLLLRKGDGDDLLGRT